MYPYYKSFRVAAPADVSLIGDLNKPIDVRNYRLALDDKGKYEIHNAAYY